MLAEHQLLDAAFERADLIFVPDGNEGGLSVPTQKRGKR
jgi:hypothetical protein